MGRGGAVFVSAYTDYSAEYTVYERNKADLGGAIYLDAVPGSAAAIYAARKSAFIDNVCATRLPPLPSLLTHRGVRRPLRPALHTQTATFYGGAIFLAPSTRAEVDFTTFRGNQDAVRACTTVDDDALPSC